MTATMSLGQRLDLLISLAAADQDDAGALPPRLRNAGSSGAIGPLNLRTVRPGPGRKMTLLRVLMTNACSFNCHYCPMRRDRELPRTLLKPAELVRIFLEAHRREWCQGLFITTGIPGRPVKVMDDLIEVLELLRERHRFAGYIHVKMVPGAEPAQVERLTALASRVSLNLEAPCGASLSAIAPDKDFTVSLAGLRQVRSLVVREWAEEADGKRRDRLHPGGTSGMTVQFVVGATPDTDRTLLRSVRRLYARGGVHHTHFSAFRPIRNTPMEQVRAAPALREHRLYQADHLLRQYGFEEAEVVYGPDGNLPLGVDPKSAWALSHPERFPVEVRTASYAELIRVPGVGPLSARRIVAERAGTIFRGLRDLVRLGVMGARAAGFLTVGGRRLQQERWAEQIGFWRPEEGVGAGHQIYEFSPGTFR
ncbi:MAG: putative DNA modification/repair radical SAM protein [Gemmatimonadales bacterium]|nr:putative DNA modification/repair radical SAM protein [Gemmatimonadales bacterium]